jgi:hypothetical protein
MKGFTALHESGCGRYCCKKILRISGRATFTQSQARMRKADSKIHSSRFDCCAFLFYKFPAVTFATISAQLRHDSQARQCPVLRQERTQHGQTAMSHLDPKRSIGSQLCCDAQHDPCPTICKGAF